MTKQDVKKLDTRMRTIRNCFKKDMQAIDEILDKIDGKYMREQGVDYVIEYIKTQLCTLHLDMSMFNRTMDMEMKECLYYLNEMVSGEAAPECEPNLLRMDVRQITPAGTRQEMPEISWDVLVNDEEVVNHCPVVRLMKDLREK